MKGLDYGSGFISNGKRAWMKCSTFSKTIELCISITRASQIIVLYFNQRES